MHTISFIEDQNLDSVNAEAGRVSHVINETTWCSNNNIGSQLQLKLLGLETETTDSKSELDIGKCSELCRNSVTLDSQFTSREKNNDSSGGNLLGSVEKTFQDWQYECTRLTTTCFCATDNILAHQCNGDRLGLNGLLGIRSDVHTECIVSENLVIVVVQIDVHGLGLGIVCLLFRCRILGRLSELLFTASSNYFVKVDSRLFDSHALLCAFETPTLKVLYTVVIGRLVASELEIRVHSTVIVVIESPDTLYGILVVILFGASIALRFL
ncbi:hypothetical protein HG531_011379 [Fusarium graminearum]|nr:hypothetical protein HG531_011379 [Fusarium graminearum]